MNSLLLRNVVASLQLASLQLASLQLASLYLPFSANLLMYIVFLCNLSYM